MPNQNAPFGFRPVRRLDGAAPNYATRQYDILSTYTTKIYKYDPVKISTAGNVELAGTTDYPLLGVFDGCEYMDTVQNKRVFSALWTGASSAVANTVKANIIIDPSAVFKVRSNGAVITKANTFANAQYAAGTGNDVSGLSGASLAASTLNTTNTLPFKVVGLFDGENNDNASSYNIVEVIMNLPVVRDTTGVA